MIVACALSANSASRHRTPLHEIFMDQAILTPATFTCSSPLPLLTPIMVALSRAGRCSRRMLRSQPMPLRLACPVGRPHHGVVRRVSNNTALVIPVCSCRSCGARSAANLLLADARLMAFQRRLTAVPTISPPLPNRRTAAPYPWCWQPNSAVAGVPRWP